MTDIDEACAAAVAAKETGLPVFVSFSFRSTGPAPEDAARELAAIGVDAIGANCGSAIGDFAGICARLRAACDLPVWIKPSAGLPRVEDNRVIYDMTPRQFAAAMVSIVAAGASFIGGCCGTTPEFIRELNRLV
jgi:methionine synthase I (cobalamin-dependent)